MKAEIKTTTTETVHLELSIQEAHYLRAIIGRTPKGEGRDYGVPYDNSMFDTLNAALGVGTYRSLPR